MDGGSRKERVDVARSMAESLRLKLNEARGENRVQAARELYRYVNEELKDESTEFIEEFLSSLDGKTDSSVYSLISSTNVEEKKSGIFMIVCLAEHQSGVRYANYLLKILNYGTMEEESIKMACRALAYLIQTSKSYAAELVDRSLDQCMEWLQEEKGNENRKLAAAHLSRELAIFTPTAFFLRANLFFKYIFNALRETKAVVRLAAIEALHAVLTITSQREAKQKTEWYTKCFQEAMNTETITRLPKEDAYHSIALVLNELLRISDAKLERKRLDAFFFEKQYMTMENPIDWLVLPRYSETVESTTARLLVRDKMPEIISCAERMIHFANSSNRAAAAAKNPTLNIALMQLLPRISAFSECTSRFQQIAYDTALQIMPKQTCAAPAVGMIMLNNPSAHKGKLRQLVNFVTDMLNQKKKNFDDNYFVFLFLLADAYPDAEEEFKTLVPALFKLPLSRGLTNVLKMIMLRVPKLRLMVQDGVMAAVYLELTGVPIPSKCEPAPRPAPPRHISANAPWAEVERVVLAIDTLGEFYFSRGALQRIMQYIADYYLVADHTHVRLATVKCCCSMIVPFVAVYKKVTTEKRQHMLTTIQDVLRALVAVIVVDSHVEVRMQVIRSFREMSRPFLVHLAQPEMLEMQFMALHDERLEMQESCVTLLGRLAELNPALVFPRMRRMLLETLSQLTNSGQARLEQHSARMVALLGQQSPKFMRPYIGSLLTALIPKLRNELKYAEVTVHVLNAISELSIIGGAELVRNIDQLFQKLTVMITDSSSLQRREAALRAIGRICRSTAYVVDPYKQYPSLLDDLLRLLKTVMSSSMRREAIKVLGILGAIDPYTHKVFTGAVQSATAISTAMSLPISQEVQDPRQDIVLWFNYEKCTLEEFYPAITIANLMMMIQDEAFSASYREIAQALLTIFRSLGNAFPQYVEQVVPRLIEVCRGCSGRPDLREFFLRQLSLFVAIIKQHATPYMKSIFSLIADSWSEDKNLKMTVVSILEEMGTALGPDFSSYIGELIPYLLHVLQTDKTRDRSLSNKVMTCMRPLCSCLTSHLHLVLPPILILLDDCAVPIYTRATALDTVLHLTRNVDVSSYAPRLMQTWHHCISTVDLQPRLMELLIEVIKQLCKHFEVFRRNVDQRLYELGLNKGESFEIYRVLAQAAGLKKEGGINPFMISTEWRKPQLHTSQSVTYTMTGINGSLPSSTGLLSSAREQSDGSKETYNDGLDNGGVVEKSFTSRPPSSAARSTTEILVIPISKQRLNYEAVSRAWQVESLSSREEWAQWLLKLRIAFLKSGSSPSLRAASGLSDQHPHLAKDLFNAAFMSVWTELESQKQNELTNSLLVALDSGHPDVIQTILNLAEFMDHSEKGPLPITHKRLGESAEETKAYAKALRYKELQILARPAAMKSTEPVLYIEDCQALITFANKLNVQEEAAGVVRYAERDNMKIPMRGRWYEKLNEWEKALESYEKDREDGEGGEDTTNYEMRCLEALGHWERLNDEARKYKEKWDAANVTGRQATFDHKVAVMAARGAWAVKEWKTMNDYVQKISENSQDGAMLRAVVSVHAQEYDMAVGYIDKVRDMYDSELTTMASESYERAYGAMVFVQQMAEIEECIEFQVRPERRPRVALLWSRRLQGCRQNVEQWQRLLMLRALVLSPQEMHPLRVKFASLCRKQGKVSMCRAVLRDLLGLDPDAPLYTASVPQDKPQLVLALCKQLWADDMKGAAINTLEALARHLEKLPKNLHSPEASRLCSKVFSKLGEWTDTSGMNESKGAASHKNSLSSLGGEYNSQPIHQPKVRVPAGFQKPAVETTIAKVIRYYARATDYDPKWHKAWHKLASAYFYAIPRDRESIEQMRNFSSPASPRPLMSPQLSMSQNSMPIPQPLGDLNLPAALGPLPGLPGGGMTVQTSMLPGQLMVAPPTLAPGFASAPSPGPQSPQFAQCLSYAQSAIRCFSKALTFAPGSRLEDTLRLMQLWFDFGENSEVYTVLKECVTELPINTWLEVVPQMMARLDSKERPVQLIINVICEISKKQPQALVYALTVAAKSQNEDRAKNAAAILQKMSEHHPRLVDEAQLVSDELVRCAILWHEKWHDALDEASRLYFHDNNVTGMFEALRELHNMMKQGPKTLKEQSFNQTYYCDLKDAYKFCQAYERSKNAKDLNQAWEIYCGVFKRLRDQLQSLTTLDLNYVSPALMRAKDLELSVPGTYDPTAPIVGISSFGTRLTVITSKQRPRKMMIRGSNGLEYHFLLKGHEDPRQDERVMQLFGLVNTLLANNSETCRRNLTIQRYSIVALSKDSGLIGWVPNCDTLHSLVKDYREKKKKISLSTEHKALQYFTPDTEHLTVLQKLQVFEKALAATTGDDLRHVLWLKSPSSEVWFDRRTNYTRSMACMSMVGYILGLGDRHPSNLMLDRLTGKIVHIDFGDCFEVAMSREKFPEKIPFRLTRMLINAMEVTGIEGTYRFTCERVLKVLRTNRESMLAVLEAFVYDPVINWRLLDSNKRIPGEKKDHSKMNLQEAPRAVSQGVINRIKQKLTGTEFETGREEAVSEQLERLVEQATMHINLCQCYIGWCPFW